MPRARRTALAVALGLALSCACTTTGTTPDDGATAGTTTGTTAPAITFYRPATVLASGAPGDVLELSPTTLDPTWPGTAQRMRYVSTTPAGDLVPVTGVVLTPTTPAPPGGYPILVWAHGTVGIGDTCAPSRVEPFGMPAGDRFLAAGYLVVAPDYEGLGIEGETHPYLVGSASGHNVLDAARVGRLLGGGSRTAVFGWSQGGHATLFARDLAPGYAPDLDVVGVVAAAPVTDPALFLLQGRTDPDIFPFTAEAILAWSEVYDEPQLGDLVNEPDAERARLARDDSCTGDLVTDQPLDQIFLAEPDDLDIWRAVSDLNRPRTERRDIPVLLTHGDADALVPVAGTVDHDAALCASGEAVTFRRDPSWGHTLAWVAPVDEIVSWIGDRFAGTPAPTTCA